MTISPTIDRNKADYNEDLFDQNRYVRRALYRLIDAIREDEPHPRDYKTMPEGSYGRAMAEHRGRIAIANTLLETYNFIGNNLCQQMEGCDMLPGTDD